jgi:bifunctional non-homologous end joining protein LigD
VYRPDYLHFDLDPVKGTPLKKVLETALHLHETLQSLKIASLVKTTGSRGLHIYVPIVRGPTQKEVWTFSKAFAHSLAARYPRLITVEYRVEKRPAGHVLVDYNQNAWGRTLASVYSVRPRPQAPVSMPVRWEEVTNGFRLEDFRIDNAPARIRRLGDLWKPLLLNRGRVRLERLL